MSTRFGLADQDVFHSLWHVAVYPEASFTSECSGAGMPQSLLLDKVPRASPLEVPTRVKVVRRECSAPD